MNRLLSILCTALLVAGCTEDYSPQGRSDGTIRIAPTTTRASVSRIADMHTDFRVFATAADIGTTGDWYPGIDGANNHVYSGGQWGFQTPVAWPTDPAKYPMTFYAWYPVSPTGMNLTATPGATPTLQADITVQPMATDQVDIVASRATIAARPVNSNLHMTFDHILSKVDFGIIAGNEATPYIAELELHNLGDTRRYDFVAGRWTGTDPTPSTSYVYFQDNVVPWSPGRGDETTAVPFFTDSDEAHLMLMPQSNPVWQQGNDFTSPGDGAFVSIRYRMTNADGDQVGFAAASSHPDFATLGDGYTGPLYVMAAFPLPYDNTSGFAWDSGKGYRYNVGLGTVGSSNGYAMNDHYYRSDGSLSTLPLIDGRQTGEPLNDGVIHIELATDDWGDEPDGGLPPISGTDVQVGFVVWAGRNVAAPGEFAPTDQRYDTNQYTWDEARASSVPTGSLDGSVCPAGWRLPTVDDFYNLVQANITPFQWAGSDNPDQYYNDVYYHNEYDSGRGWDDTGFVAGETFIVPSGTLFFPASGRSGASKGALGAYWASTEYNATNGYRMDYHSTLIGPTGWSEKTLLLSVRCVRPIPTSPNIIAPAAPYIVYWDDTTGTMQVGSWNAITGGAVKQENQMFFQMGSTVGFLNDNGDGGTWDASQIKFNVTGTTDYTSLPNWENYTGDKTSTADGYLSTADYHNAANVSAGRGDPCKLVGLTVDQLKAGLIDNGRYRMATATDQLTAGWISYGTSPGTYTPNTTYGLMSAADTFMPASGARNPSGVSYDVGTLGWAWTSRPNGGTGYYTWSSQLGSDGNPRSAMPIRCLGQTPYPVSAAAGTGGTAKATSDTGGANAITQAPEGQIVTFTATPAPGYVFAGWTVTTAPAGFTLTAAQRTDNSFTITMPAGAVTLTASFNVVLGVRNAGNTPGVIGYIWNPGQADHLTLTLDKDDNDDTNGIVYVAMFKYNSLVALSSQNTSAFTPNDVVAWPTPDWAADRAAMEAKFSGAADATAAYALITASSTISSTPNPANAQGDACAYYFGSEWRMPTRAESEAFTGGSSGSISAGTFAYTPASGYQPGLGLFIAGPLDPSGNPYSLPITGNRITDGKMTLQGDYGYYWTSSSRYFLMFQRNNSFSYSQVSTGTLQSIAKPIRCHPPVQNPVGVVVIPSADGTYATEWAKTNLSAKGVFATSETDDGVFFQWGRNVAYPYDYGSALPASAVDQTGNATWPAATNPCPEGGWRLPTQEECARFDTVMTDPGNAGDRTFTSPYGSLIIPAAGNLSSSGAGSSQGQSARYWSNDQNVDTNAYILSFVSTGALNSISYGNKTLGYSVRCVRTQ